MSKGHLLPNRDGFLPINDPAEEWRTSYDLDLGDGHFLAFGYRGIPQADGVHRHDDPVNPQPVGGIIYHHQDDREKGPRGYCSGGITFDVPHGASRTGPRWQVSSWDPLTCSPSFLCHCGDHGFIREGRWVRA